jgi:hypothetical protein
VIRVPMPAAARSVLVDLGEILTAGRLDSPDLIPVETYTHGFSGICFCSAQHVRSFTLPGVGGHQAETEEIRLGAAGLVYPGTMSSPIVDRGRGWLDHRGCGGHGRVGRSERLRHAPSDPAWPDQPDGGRAVQQRSTATTAHSAGRVLPVYAT